MKKALSILFFIASGASLSPAAPTLVQVEQWSQTAEDYRLAQNIGAFIVETLLVAHNKGQTAVFVEDHFMGILHTMNACRLPALALAATAELDFSTMGELTDMVANLGIKGFWYHALAGNLHERNITVASILLLNNLVATALFNAVNHAVKVRFPSSEDEFKRRLLRMTAVLVGNVMVPLLAEFVDSTTGLICFGGNRMETVMNMVFWTTIMNHAVAEAAGYTAAQYLKECAVVAA